MSDIASLVSHSKEEGKHSKRFILVTTIGDPSWPSNTLEMSATTLETLLVTSKFPPHVMQVFSSEQFHLSHHTHHDETTGMPLSISIILRAPRNSRVVNCVLRIDVKDLSCVCLIAAAREQTMNNLRNRWIEDFPSSKLPFLSFLNLILQERTELYTEWFSNLCKEVTILESSTRMTPNTWRTNISSRDQDSLSNYDNLLRRQHATNTELCHCETVLSYLINLGEFCLDFIELIQSVRQECGFDMLKKHVCTILEEEVHFILGRSKFSKDKLNEVLNRIRAQISVSFSLVAQRDSKITLAAAQDSNRIAGFAAKDSETMKTITVLTLVFLPPSLVTAIWSADIFHMDTEKNWKVYLGTCVGVTAVVLSFWIAYRVLRSRQRSDAAGLFETKEKAAGETIFNKDRKVLEC
ncbi:hypothetical protein BS50DRAFT_618400 [Corynespora cassiicola Philippines]|uniref:Cora-domain-containing protein n=1 Tax=Corynespora cassiicola Philippines TaxID=1448308 RepID=A0A2T2P134_CORCC|nr:hypothetical protein BS50DRAFT_618400 [Corynespora cassiicola Philippines]